MEERMKNAECPVCKGDRRQAATGIAGKRSLQGYDEDTDTIPCQNCGGQYQFGAGPSGKVRRRPSGEPCRHKYGRVKTLGRTFTVYQCTYCGDTRTIDSGD